MAQRDKKRIMILGCGSCQMEAIKKVRRLGMTAIAASNDPECPGRSHAHHFINVSTFDPQGIYEAVCDLRADGLVVTGTDQPLLTAAVVSKKTGLPFFLDPETALSLTNKKFMKASLSEAGIPVVPWSLVDRKSIRKAFSRISTPLVIKPLDSQGQRGVFLIHDGDDVRAFVHRTLSFSRENEAILEEYYPGAEMTVSGWVEKGNLRILSVTDRISFQDRRHIGICRAHIYPSLLLPRLENEIEKICSRCVHAFGIDEGPVYIQLLYGTDGLKVNEVTARIGGAYEEVFIPRLTGFDILDAVIRKAAGLPAAEGGVPLSDVSAPRYSCIASQLFFLKPGRVHSAVPSSRVLTLPGVAGAFHSTLPGYESKAIVSSGQRAGFVVIGADSREELNRRIRRVYETLRIENREGEQMIIPFQEMRKGL